MRALRSFSLHKALLVAVFASAPAAAQAGVTDAGTFRITVGGQSAGTEEFSIRQSGSGAATETIATGRVQVRLPSGTLDLAPRLRATGVQGEPVSYQIDIGGTAPERIVGTVGSGRFSAKIVTAAGEQLREYVASAGAVVLDEGVAHHYYFLAQRGPGRFPVLVPRENRQVIATVSQRSEERLTVGDRTAPVYRFTVQLAGGAPRTAWVDDLNRVIKVEIPERGYVAVRTELPR